MSTNDLMSLSEVRSVLPGRPCASTIRRWMTVGIDGVKMWSVLIGRRRFTSAQAIEDFLVSTNGDGVSEIIQSIRAECGGER